jgi:hypothetical protein
VGPKELDIKLQEFEARLTMINRELEELIKTAKDIEYRAKMILKAYDKWPTGIWVPLEAMSGWWVMHLARLRVGTEKENALLSCCRLYAIKLRNANSHRLPTSTALSLW